MPVTPIGPQRTYGKNKMGRGFAIKGTITPGSTLETIPRMFDGNALSIPASTKATIAADNDIKWGTRPTGAVAGTGPKKPGLLSRLFNNETLGKVNNVANEISPYISNISNAFRKAPRPLVPVLDSYTNLSKVDLSNERSMVRRTTDAANKATERNVDSNTAEAIKAFNRGQEFNQLSSVNERELNANTGINNQQAMMDAQVKGNNTERWNDYNNAKTAADIADVRERSANMANFGDKVTLIGNEKRKAKVARDKVRVMSSLFNKSGVLSRQAREFKKMGIDDPLEMDYSYMESDEDYNKRKDVKAYGGMMKKVPNRKLFV